MKNRRRFITRDVRLDIPEDRELRLTSTDDVIADDETLAQDENSSNLTWPRLRGCRPGLSFASPFGLQQVSSSSSSSHLLHHHQPTMEQDGGHFGREEGTSFQRSGNDWRYRSHSAASSPCLSNLSPISTSRPETCLKSQRHDDASFDDVILSGGINYRHSPGDVMTSTSGLDAKRRSRSLNETNSHLPFFTHHPRGPSLNSPRPGSVLHRAMVWESAGKLHPRSPSRSPRPSNAGFADNFADISTQQVKKTNDSTAEYFPLESVSISGKSGNPDHFGFHLRVPSSSSADPVQNAPSGKCLSRHSFDMGRSNNVRRTANGNPHWVERAGSARVSPVHESVYQFPAWKNPQNRELFPGSGGTRITDPLDPRDRKFVAETQKTNAWIDNNNGSGFRKPFRSKSFKLLTFDPVENSSPAVNGSCGPGQRSTTSPDFVSINSTAGGRFQVDNESFHQPKLHLSMLSLNSESRRHHQNNEGSNPRALSSSNLTAQSTGFSTGNSTGFSTGNSTGFSAGNSTGYSTGNSVVDGRHIVGFSRADESVSTSPSCGENRGNFSNSLSAHRTTDSRTDSQRSDPLFRPVSSNLVVKRLTNLTKNPFAPNSKLEELHAPTSNAPVEALSRTGQNSNTVNSSINKRDNLLPVNTESIRSDPRPIPFMRLVSSGKVERVGNIEYHALEKSRGGISSIEIPDIVGKNGKASTGVFHKNPKFTSAKEMYLENPSADPPSPEIPGKPRINPDTGPPVTASESIRPDGTPGGVRPNGDSAPTRLIRVFLKSSTQLKDEAGGRDPIGSAEIGSDMTCKLPTQSQLKENILDIDTALSTIKAFDSIINNVNMELESTKYCNSAPISPNQQTVSLGKIEPRQIPTNNQGHIDRNFAGSSTQSTRQTVYQNPALQNAEDPTGRPSASKRPFEIVKKRLIIPESMAPFRSKDDEKIARRGPNFDVNHYNGNFGKDGKGTVTVTSPPPPINCPDISSKGKTTMTTDSPTSKSVPSTLDRRASGPPGPHGPPAGATVKCSDLETALRKIEADMGIIAKAGAKIPPGIVKIAKPSSPLPLPLQTTIKTTTTTTTNTCKGNRQDSSGVVSQTTCLFTCPDEYNEATKIRLQTSGISTGGGGGPPSPDYHPGIRPSSSASSSSFVTTELDRAIEMLTQQQQVSSSSSQVEQRTGVSDVRMPPTRTQVNIGSQSRKEFASSSPSPSPARHSPASKITVHLEKDGKDGRKMTEISAEYLERYTSPVSAQSSCASMEPIRTVRLDPLLVVDAADWRPETGARNRRLVASAVRDDSFDRPDSPLIRKTLPLPKDSVIMRHRMHQKELRRPHHPNPHPHHRARVAPGTAGSLSLSSSSEASDDDGSAMRLAPKRTAKSKGVTAVKEEEDLEESSDRNEDESIFSSNTSIRPLSVDGSLLSEENL